MVRAYTIRGDTMRGVKVTGLPLGVIWESEKVKGKGKERKKREEA